MPISTKKKKVPAKGLTAKKKTTKKKTRTVSRKKDAIDLLLASINKELKDGGSVQRGEEITYLNFERIPSGSLGLDIIMGGGIPRSAITQYKGIESAAKTTMAMHAFSIRQREGEDVAWAASEGFDKKWARKNGCFIPYNEKELELLVRNGKLRSASHAQEFAERYLAKHDGWGTFSLVQTRSSPKLLEVASQLVRAGLYGLVALDSAGALISDEDDEKEVGDATRVGGNAKIITHFVNKVRKSFNAGVPSTKDVNGKTIKCTTPNQTAVIVINQVRDRIGAWSPRGTPEPEAGGGYGLKHGKDIDIRFSKGDLLTVSVRGQKIVYGRQVKAKCEKNKTAAPYRQASWYLYFKSYKDEGIKSGTIDLADEVLQYGRYYGLIEQSGHFYNIEGEKLNGAEAAVMFLREQPEILTAYRQTILELAGQGE